MGVLYGNVPYTVVLGTLTFTAGNTFFYSLDVNFGSATFAAIGATQFTSITGINFVNTAKGDYQAIQVIYKAGVEQTLIPTSAPYCPVYSRYNGVPIAELASYSNDQQKKMNSYRNIAAGVLFSNVTNQFNVGGSLIGLVVDSGQLLSEASLGGPASASSRQGLEINKATQGMYISPVKVKDVNTRHMRSFNSGFDGSQPYSVVYSYAPPANGVANSATSNAPNVFKVEMADVYEMYLGLNQSFPKCSASEDTQICKYLSDRPHLLTENPFHLSSIFNWVQNVTKVAAPLLTTAAEITGNPYLKGAAVIGNSINSVINS